MIKPTTLHHVGNGSINQSSGQLTVIQISTNPISYSNHQKSFFFDFWFNLNAFQIWSDLTRSVTLKWHASIDETHTIAWTGSLVIHIYYIIQYWSTNGPLTPLACSYMKELIVIFKVIRDNFCSLPSSTLNHVIAFCVLAFANNLKIFVDHWELSFGLNRIKRFISKAGQLRFDLNHYLLDLDWLTSSFCGLSPALAWTC